MPSKFMKQQTDPEDALYITNTASKTSLGCFFMSL